MVEGGSGRWASADCAGSRPFACAKPRSESGLDPLDWTDPLGEQWKITTSTGTWTEGENACQSEFPGYTFGVPVNGYQNRKLKDANTATADLWLNYNQRDVRGRWVIGRRSHVDAPPVADAGRTGHRECGNVVTLDGPLERPGLSAHGALVGAVGTTGASETVSRPGPRDHADRRWERRHRYRFGECHGPGHDSTDDHTRPVTIGPVATESSAGSRGGDRQRPRFVRRGSAVRGVGVNRQQRKRKRARRWKHIGGRARRRHRS